MVQTYLPIRQNEPIGQGSETTSKFYNLRKFLGGLNALCTFKKLGEGKTFFILCVLLQVWSLIQNLTFQFVSLFCYNQGLWYTIVPGNASGFVKNTSNGFPANQSNICHSWFRLNSVFFEAPCSKTSKYGTFVAKIWITRYESKKMMHLHYELTPHLSHSADSWQRRQNTPPPSLYLTRRTRTPPHWEFHITSDKVTSNHPWWTRWDNKRHDHMSGGITTEFAWAQIPQDW